MAFMFQLLFEMAEVVDYGSDQQIKSEKCATNNKGHKVEVSAKLVLALGLLVNPTRIHSSSHHLQPSFKRRNLKERKERVGHVIKVHFGVNPLGAVDNQRHTCSPIGHSAHWKRLTVAGNTDRKLASKMLHTSNGKDEPDYSTNYANIKDARYGANNSGHNEAYAFQMGDDAKTAEGSQNL